MEQKLILQRLQKENQELQNQIARNIQLQRNPQLFKTKRRKKIKIRRIKAYTRVSDVKPLQRSMKDVESNSAVKRVLEETILIRKIKEQNRAQNHKRKITHSVEPQKVRTIT